MTPKARKRHEKSKINHELQAAYGVSIKGNFDVIDTIPVPHPYCLTPKHVAVASDLHMGMLTPEAVRDAETRGAKCDICRQINRREPSRPILTYDEHEKALLIRCHKDMKKDEDAKHELTQYLLSIKQKATDGGFAGFAFMLNDAVERRYEE